MAMHVRMHTAWKDVALSRTVVSYNCNNFTTLFLAGANDINNLQP